MKIKLEVHQGKLVARFSVNRDTFRYPSSIKMTPEEWEKDQANGFKKSRAALTMVDEMRKVLGEMNLSEFTLKEFKARMAGDLVAQEPLSKWMDKYIAKRSSERISIKTKRMDESMHEKLKLFLADNKDADNIQTFSAQTLDAFYTHMRKTVSQTTARIYLITLRTFFNWLVNDLEILSKSPYKRFKLPTSKSHWAPYNEEELKTILKLKPEDDAQTKALSWVRLLLYTGGTDMKDFAELKWKQVRATEMHMVRTKSRESSSEGEKIVYLGEFIKGLVSQLSNKKGAKDDYVFPIYRKDANESQKAEHLNQHLKHINKAIQTMLDAEESSINFTLKRIRPTSAMIANNSVGDINFVKMMLQHSNISQTDTYLKRTPSEVMKKNQAEYEKALTALEVKE